MRRQLADEPADGGVGPVRLVAEHVVPDELDDPLADRRAAHAKPIEERAGQLRPDRVVADEVAVGERRRLADVVEQGGEPNDRAGPPAPRPPTRSVWSHRSSPGILFWAMPALRGEVRRDRREEARSRPAAAARPTAIGAASSLSSSAAIRSPDRWATSSARAWIPASVARLDPEPEGRREADGADHPQGVLLEPGARLADGAQDARRGVGAPAVRIDEAPAARPAARPRPSR